MFKEYVNPEKLSESEKSAAEMEIKKADDLRSKIISVLDKAIANLEAGVEVEANTKSAVNIKNQNNYSDYDKPITISDIKTLRSIGQKSVNDFTSNDIEPMITNLPSTAKVIVNKKSEFKSTSGTLIQSQGLNAQFVFTEDSIPQSDSKGNTKKSLDVYTEDSEGNTLSEQQQEFFKDSKVRDKRKHGCCG